jgi:Holliday junction resolvase
VRLRAKRDANEKAIVEALEAYGAYVFRVSGEGVPDLFVHYRGVWTPLEVKAKRGTLTKRQAAVTHAIPIVRTVDEALAAIGVKGQG